jgi:AAA domain
MALPTWGVIMSDIVAETERIKRQGLERLQELCEQELLPGGKKEGNHYRCGSINGDKGRSFDVNLSNGKFGDFASDEKMRSGAINLWMEVKGVDFNTARTQLAAWLGIPLSPPRTAQEKSSATSNGAFDWEHCVDAIRGSDLLREVREWRGFSPEFCDWLVSHRLIGSVYGGVAFPIHDEHGKVIGSHFLKSRPKGWMYSRGSHVTPLIIGNPEKATEIHIHESTWDGLDFCDKTQSYKNTDVCVIITRGVTHASKLNGIIPKGRRVYAWPQNDKVIDIKTGKIPSEQWFDTVRENLERSFYRAATPPEFADLNDWTRAGATKNDLVDAISDATLIEKDDGDDTEYFDFDALMGFDRENDPDNVIGNRWICRGDSFILQGYTGIGKSSLALQAAIYMVLGKPIFACIRVIRPLKVLIIQAENNKGDVAEPLQDICDHLGLSDSERRELKSRLVIGRQSSKCGAVAFAAYFNMLIEKHRPDVCIFDPLLSYFGKDLSSQEAASEFFRRHLQPIQNRTGVIIGFLHHLGKPPRTGDQRQGPVLYSGFGSSDIFNWAREVITLMTNDEGCHTLEFGKRGTRAGIVDDTGQSVTELRVQRATGVRCYWSVTDSQPQAGDKSKKDSKTVDLVKALEQVPVLAPELKDAVIRQIATACKCGINPARTALNQLTVDGKVKDVSIENPNPKARDYAAVIRCSTDNPS